MSQPSSCVVTCDGKTYHIPIISNALLEARRCSETVNIIASGPSIKHVEMDNIRSQACIFVNGSIQLTTEHTFTNVLAYVISDKRFIEHAPEVFIKHYQGQLLYVTENVIKAIASRFPEIIAQHHQQFVCIFSVLKPVGWKRAKRWRFWQRKNRKLSRLKPSPHWVIDKNVGVSLNIAHGFIEAGTVAYIAAQLAHSLGATGIQLFGVDLINANLPRFYESTDQMAPSKLDQAVESRIVPSFELMGRVYAERGITVINRSPVSQALFSHLPFQPNDESREE